MFMLILTFKINSSEICLEYINILYILKKKIKKRFIYLQLFKNEY